MSTRSLAATRRDFLKSAGTVGTLALTIGFEWGGSPRHAFAAPAVPIGAAFTPNAFLRIAPDNSVTVIAKHVELGQGAYTGIATIVAEELDADWTQVRVESAPADAKRYANLVFGTMQGTGGSSAMANSWTQLREAGKRQARVDAPAKCDGTAQFTLDAAMPGMLVALLKRPPLFGATVKSFDPTAAAAVPGMVKVVQVPRGVAVIGKGFWAAKQGRDALKVQWDDSHAEKRMSAAIMDEYRRLADQPGLSARADGDAAKAIQGAARKISATCEFPYLAHAPMEPLDAVVKLTAGSCGIWAGDQFQTIDQANAARTAGLDPQQVSIHTLFAGGSFGRRANPGSDYIVEAVSIAKAYGADGQLTGWRHVIVGQSILGGTPMAAMMKDGIDPTSVEGASTIAYSIPNVAVELSTTQTGVPALWWRVVGNSHTAFAVETFIDEVAHAAGQDGFQFRRKLLDQHPRMKAVLELAAEKAGWGTPLPPGKGRASAFMCCRSPRPVRRDGRVT
jgi:isoquinoline 1-oxidoreductase subunit beta